MEGRGECGCHRPNISYCSESSLSSVDSAIPEFAENSAKFLLHEVSCVPAASDKLVCIATLELLDIACSEPNEGVTSTFAVLKTECE